MFERWISSLFAVLFVEWISDSVIRRMIRLTCGAIRYRYCALQVELRVLIKNIAFYT